MSGLIRLTTSRIQPEAAALPVHQVIRLVLGCGFRDIAWIVALSLQSRRRRCLPRKPFAPMTRTLTPVGIVILSVLMFRLGLLFSRSVRQESWHTESQYHPSMARWP